MRERSYCCSVVVAVPEDSQASKNAVTTPDGTSKDNGDTTLLSNVRLVQCNHDDEDDEHCDMRHIEHLIADPSDKKCKSHHDEHGDTCCDSECLHLLF